MDFVMLGRRSPKTGRIIKNEQYSIREFASRVPFRITLWSAFTGEARLLAQYQLEVFMTERVRHDNFGQKKRKR